MTSDAKTILITRRFDAPSALVFECWLKPEHLIHWYNAGDGWTTPYAETDPRQGGRFKIGFAGPDGKVAFNFTGTYDEVTPPESGKTGRIRFAIDDGRPVTVEFSEQDGRTLVSLTLTLETTHSEEQQRHGWSVMLENLGLHLERNVA
jgi:uncharacterized protein YndB with AHSA1/START domain